MTDRELMKQALRYMESIGEMDTYPEDWAIALALRERLAQPEPKPLAWIDANHLQYAMREPSVCRLMPVPGKGYVPLYATLREWEGLTDEEIAELHHEIKVRLIGTYKTEDIYRAIEAKLKEKNT